MQTLRMLAGLAFAASCVAAPTMNVASSGNGGVASQISTIFGGDAFRANDGNTDGIFEDNSVSHTDNLLPNAWWQVTFSQDYYISSIVIFNRTDCCQDRINTFSVFLYDDSNAVVWSSTGNSINLPATTATFSVPSIHARSLRVRLDGTNYLALAEVQAFGTATPPATPAPPSLILALVGLGSGGAATWLRSRRRKRSAAAA